MKLTLASPCAVKWSSMKGTDRVRFCGKCQLNVYDISRLTEAEAEALVQQFNGARLCVRLFQRRDGRVLTRDCELSKRSSARRARAAGIAGALSSIVAVAASIVSLMANDMRRLFGDETGGALAGEAPPPRAEPERLPHHHPRNFGPNNPSPY